MLTSRAGLAKFLLVLLAYAALSAAVPAVFSSYWTLVALNLAMWIALTQSWALFSGMTGYVSLGHVVFYGIGAYVVASSFKVIPVWLSIPLGGLVAGLFALIIAIPVLRVRGPYFVILTFGVAELIKFSLLNLETSIGKSSRLLFGAPATTSLLYTMIGLAVTASLLTYWVSQSRFGRGLRAIKEDEIAAETIGVPVVFAKVLVFSVSAVIPGMVGGVMALRSTYFEVLQVFDPTISFTVVSMAIIGGSGDARGPLMGAAFMIVLSELLWTSAPRLYMILLGALLILFVIFVPSGMAGLLLRRAKGRTS